MIAKECSRNINVLGLLQARVSSSRLPGKVLKEILGKPMLLHQIERLQRCSSIEKLVVVTSDQVTDTPLVEMLEQHGVDYYRGSLEDVLDRYFQAAKYYGAKHVVRLTGDCPVADPDVVDLVVQSHLQGDNDYTSNVFPPTYPDGLDVEVMRFDALQKTWEEAKLPSEREHVTQYIVNNSSMFSLRNVESENDYSALRWTVDELEDLHFIRAVFEELYPSNERFSRFDIMELLKRKPALIGLNNNINRNEGIQKALGAG